MINIIENNDMLIETEMRFVVARSWRVGGRGHWVKVIKRYKLSVVR